MNTFTCTAFEGCRRIASGPLPEVAAQTKRVLDETPQASVLIFDDATAEQIEVDFRGSVEDVLMRLKQPEGRPEETAEQPEVPRGRGRPKIGVVAREVTLLPRHWEWLNSQPGGASVALRKLVEEARKVNQEGDAARQARDAAYRFMSAMAGDLPGFEEATRALFSGNVEQLSKQTGAWPVDVRDYVLHLSDNKETLSTIE